MQHIRNELERRKRREEQESPAATATVTRNSSAGNVRDLIMDTIGAANGPLINQNGLYNVMSNLGIIFGFAAFAYAVKYILLNISYE